jgi:hypothetical protein
MSDWAAKKTFMLNAMEQAKGIPAPEFIADHCIANYIAAIKKNL